MGQMKVLSGIAEVPELEPSLFQDGYDEVRREINHLLATLKAMIVLLPQAE
jgi:hypothetical protein